MTRVVRDRIDGIAEPLPAGERVVWSERPEQWAFAFRLLRLRWVAGWFLLLAIWRGLQAWQATGDVGEVLSRATSILPLAIPGLGLLAALGWLMARNSTYALTGERLVVQTGVALPITVNLPLRLIDGVALRALPKGRADLVITLAAGSRLKPFALWPHVQGWQNDRVQPVLRDLSPQAQANLLPLLTRALQGTDLAQASVVSVNRGLSGLASVPPSAVAHTQHHSWIAGQPS